MKTFHEIHRHGDRKIAFSLFAKRILPTKKLLTKFDMKTFREKLATKTAKSQSDCEVSTKKLLKQFDMNTFHEKQ